MINTENKKEIFQYIFIWGWILGSLDLKKHINGFKKVDKQIKIKL